MKFHLIKNERGAKEEAVLAAVKIAGLLGLMAIAPNAIQYLYSKKKFVSESDKYYLNTVAKKLLSKGFLEIKQGQVRITEKGLQRFSELESLDWNKPKRWDGKYRLVIFDIAERKRKERNMIRNQLICLGFEKLQNSVWISPYECEEFITLMKTSRNLSDSIIYMTVESIENDLRLRKEFGLEE